jgi:hypothetical protein
VLRRRRLHREGRLDGQRRWPPQGACGDPTVPFPTDSVWGDRLVMWPDKIMNVLSREIPEESLRKADQQANDAYGNAGRLQKNSLQIGTKLELIFEEGICPVSLDRLCEGILGKAI